MSKVIYFEDGAGGLLSIAPVFDERSRQIVEVDGQEPRLETDQETAERIANSTVPVAAWAVFDVPVDDAAIYARFPDAMPARLAELKQAKREAIKQRRKAAVLNMTYDGVNPVLYGDDTAGNLLATIQALSAMPAGSKVKWKLGEGAFRNWALADYQQFFAAGMAHVSACFAREAALNDALDVCADIAAVGALDISSGWPA